MTISNRTLLKISALGGVATVTMGMLLRGKINANVKQTEYYKEALKTLRTHRGAVHLLGEPIRDKTINVGDETRNFTRENRAQYEVPVSGAKQRGTLYFWAEKRQPEDKWIVNRIELELKSDKDKRLLIKSINANASS